MQIELDCQSRARTWISSVVLVPSPHFGRSIIARKRAFPQSFARENPPEPSSHGGFWQRWRTAPLWLVYLMMCAADNIKSRQVKTSQAKFVTTSPSAPDLYVVSLQVLPEPWRRREGHWTLGPSNHQCTLASPSPARQPWSARVLAAAWLTQAYLQCSSVVVGGGAEGRLNAPMTPPRRSQAGIRTVEAAGANASTLAPRNALLLSLSRAAHQLALHEGTIHMLRPAASSQSGGAGRANSSWALCNNQMKGVLSS